MRVPPTEILETKNGRSDWVPQSSYHYGQFGELLIDTHYRNTHGLNSISNKSSWIYAFQNLTNAEVRRKQIDRIAAKRREFNRLCQTREDGLLENVNSDG